MNRAALPLVTVALAAGCTTPSTLTLQIVVPQNVDPLARAATIRVSSSAPAVTVTGTVGAHESVDVALSVPAGSETVISVDALDTTGAVVAHGQSPLFDVPAASLSLTVYLAPRGTVNVSPASPLPSGRDHLAAALAPGYGALLFGGRDATGAALSDVLLYDEFDHRLITGLPLPAPLSDVAAAPTSVGPVILLGGAGATGEPVASLGVFDPTFPPIGQYTTYGIDPSAAFAGAAIAPLGGDLFLAVGGEGPAGPSSAAALVTWIPSVGYAPLRAQLAAPRGGGVVAVGAIGPDGPGVLVTGGGPASPVGEWYDAAKGTFTPVAVSSAVGAANGAGAVTLPSGDILVVGGSVGGTPSDGAWRYVPRTGTVTALPHLLATPRASSAVAATGNDVLVAGGVDASGTPLADAEVLDATTLSHVATIPLAAPRAGGVAIQLETGDVMLAGGTTSPASKADLVELYTPR